VRLFGERVLPVCSPKLPGRNKLREPADLKHFVLLDFDDPAQLIPWLSWEVWFETMKTAMPASKGVLHFNHYDMLVRAAVNGQGVALGRLPLIDALLEDGTLVAPLTDARYSAAAQDRAYWLIAAPAARARPEVQTFMQWIRERAAPLAQEKPAPGAGAE
jgi:DNA-binding transcriptional LysR family regulator